MNLNKAIFYKSKKRILILFSLLVFVILAIFLTLSLHFSKYRIQNTLKKRDLSETIIEYNINEGQLDEETEMMLTHQRAETFALEKGYEVQHIDIISTHDLVIEAYGLDEYKVIDGKALKDLALNEIAISKEYARTLGDAVMNQEIDTGFGVLIVKSIIEYPNYELAYQPLENISQFELFKEGLKGSGITTLETVELLRKNELESINNMDALSEDEAIFDPFEGIKSYRLKIKYDQFNFDKENELLNYVTNYAHNWQISDNIASIDSLTLLTRSNPLPEMLKSAISKFVVSSILVSSVYAFYIHLKNELNSKYKTLATFHLIGVEFKHIVQTYIQFFITLFLSAFLGSLGISTLVGSYNPIFKPSIQVVLLTFGFASLFMIFIIIIFYYNLKKIQKTAYEQFQTAGSSYLKLPRMTSKNLVMSLSLRRFTKTYPLTLGFALSVALSIAVVLVSASSLYSVKNIFHPETLGLQFDYYLENPNIESFMEYKKRGMDIAQISKTQNVIFLDYTITEPVNNVTSGSVITIFDDIEPFIQVDKGEIPPHTSTFEGEDGGFDRIEVMASKRLMDTNDLRVFSDPDGPVDKHYLFTKHNLASYEQGMSIKGSFATLMDRGFMSYFYRKLEIDSQIYSGAPLHPAIVNLNGVMDAKAFEHDLDAQGISYVPIQKVLDEFRISNEHLNQDSFDILLIIAIAMSIQAFFNVSGVLVQVNLNRRKEDAFYQRMGLSERVLKRVNAVELLLRFFMSALFTLLLLALLLPLINHQIQDAFAILFLPASFLKEMLIILGFVILILWLSLKLLSKRKGDTHV